VLDSGESIELTVSVGVAGFPGDANEPSSLVDAADRALYQAKRLGRNRVLLACRDGK